MTVERYTLIWVTFGLDDAVQVNLMLCLSVCAFKLVGDVGGAGGGGIRVVAFAVFEYAELPTALKRD